MKRTTISLPNDLADALEREAHRRRIPVSKLAREAIEERLGRDSGNVRRLPFVGLGHSGHHSTARDIDKVLESEWTIDRDR
jgi:metal-responsive CopG/Arc/MetJ family transcriptional regulator